MVYRVSCLLLHLNIRNETGGSLNMDYAFLVSSSIWTSGIRQVALLEGVVHGPLCSDENQCSAGTVWLPVATVQSSFRMTGSWTGMKFHVVRLYFLTTRYWCLHGPPVKEKLPHETNFWTYFAALHVEKWLSYAITSFLPVIAILVTSRPFCSLYTYLFYQLHMYKYRQSTSYVTSAFFSLGTEYEVSPILLISLVSIPLPVRGAGRNRDWSALSSLLLQMSSRRLS